MRALLVDAGNDPDWEKVKQYRITALYFPISDSVEDVARRVGDSLAHGCAGGVFMAWNWDEFEGLDGASIAERVHFKVFALGVRVKVQFDIEAHDPELVATCLERYRALNPKVDVSWTCESMQGGWMTPEFVQRVVNAKVRVVPQCYAGAMIPVDSLAAVRDLTKRGFPDALVSPYYDAEILDRLLFWDGFAFTQGRLA